MMPPDMCPYCHKPYAYPLPREQWYLPPLSTSLTITASANTTVAVGFGTILPDNYCYGHTFVTCAECGCLVPYGFHTVEACALLRGMRDGLEQLRAWVQRQERTPQQERLPEHIDVPAAFQRAFKETEQL